MKRLSLELEGVTIFKGNYGISVAGTQNYNKVGLEGQQRGPTIPVAGIGNWGGFESINWNHKAGQHPRCMALVAEFVVSEKGKYCVLSLALLSSCF